MDALIELRGVARRFEHPAGRVDVLAGIDLALAPGELLVVLGPSGSGKTTLLNVLGGLDLPTAGEVLWGGRRLADVGERGRTEWRREWCGFVLQDAGLLPALTVRDNLRLAAALARVRVDEARVAAWLARVGLADRIDHRPGELSTGQQQRVAVARACLAEPRVLVADEPTGNLDRATGAVLAALLRELADDRGRGVVVATHDRALVDVADRVVELVDGRVVAT